MKKPNIVSGKYYTSDAVDVREIKKKISHSGKERREGNHERKRFRLFRKK